jgi:flagellar motility protein MotE (MotC chaperone)
MRRVSRMTLLLVAALTPPVARAEAPGATDINLCRAFASQAAEARHARQKQQLQDTRLAIEDRLKLLSSRTAELQQWVERRDKERERVSSNLVKIYKNVEPDTAARQLQRLDVILVAELLQKLGAKESGEILAAMDTTFASRIAQAMLLTAHKSKRETASP